MPSASATTSEPINTYILYCCTTYSEVIVYLINSDFIFVFPHSVWEHYCNVSLRLTPHSRVYSISRPLADRPSQNSSDSFQKLTPVDMMFFFSGTVLSSKGMNVSGGTLQSIVSPREMSIRERALETSGVTLDNTSKAGWS